MPDFITNYTGCWHRLQIFISGLFKYGYPLIISYNKACNICKIKCMVIKFISLGYVNNYDTNRYQEIFSKAAVYEYKILDFDV